VGGLGANASQGEEERIDGKPCAKEGLDVELEKRIAGSKSTMTNGEPGGTGGRDEGSNELSQDKKSRNKRRMHSVAAETITNISGSGTGASTKKMHDRLRFNLVKKKGTSSTMGGA